MGDITSAGIQAVLPYEDNLCLIAASGQQILDALEWGSRAVPYEYGGFLQVSGLSYEIHSYIDSACVADTNGMFAGVETTVTLEAKNHMVGVIIDRFGKDIRLESISDTHFQATVIVSVSPQFIGWIVGLGRSIRIVAPDWLVERMKEEVQRLSEQYC